jgi:hypothetical protein
MTRLELDVRLRVAGGGLVRDRRVPKVVPGAKGLLDLRPLVSYLSARWTLSSTASGQEVPGQKGDDDDRRRDSDDGDGRGGYDHAVILASVSGVETRS